MFSLHYRYVFAVLCVQLYVSIVTSEPLPFDGKVRPFGDGSFVAYMNPVTGAANHASFLEQFGDGSLGLVWFSGTKEGASKTAIVFSKLEAGSDTWTDPVIISVRDNYSNQNPVLFYDNSTSIVQCFHSQQGANAGESHSQIWHLQSSDFGDTWTTAQPLFVEPGAFPRNRIIPAMDGGLLFPIYNASKNYPLIAKSTANGRANLGNRNVWTLREIPNAASLVQPTIVRLPKTYPKLKAFFRDRRKVAIYEATSTDDGQTWETPYSFQLPNANVAIQANVVYPVRSGPIILLLNDYNGQNPLGRTPMSMAMSYDDGTTFPVVRALQVHDDNETRLFDGRSVEYSYPSIMETSDGWIHASYTYNRWTIKYIRFNYTWALYG